MSAEKRTKTLTEEEMASGNRLSSLNETMTETSLLDSTSRGNTTTTTTTTTTHSPKMSPRLSSASISNSSFPPQRIVLKVGTSSLVDIENGIKIAHVAAVVETIAKFKRFGHQVVLVSSGAVATGAHEMGITERPQTTSGKQALAAIGQIRLMREFNSMMQTMNVFSAQVLLTYINLVDETQRTNAKNTMDELFRLGVVPIVNENDTVATDGLQFGENDKLSAMVACLVDANMLILLTDVNGVYTANPNVDPNATRIPVIHDIEAYHDTIKTGGTSTFSSGGMDSKLHAAELATKHGICTTIMLASDVRKLAEDDGLILGMNHNVDFGTIFLPCVKPTVAADDTENKTDKKRKTRSVTAKTRAKSIVPSEQTCA